MRKFINSIFILTILFSPLVVTAQNQPFTPGTGSSSGSGSSGGMDFGGLITSVASCVNIGGMITSAIGSIIPNVTLPGIGSTIGSGIGGLVSKEVPTKDKSTKQKIEEGNKKDACLDAIAYGLAKKALGDVTNKTLNWVNTGFGGNPFYVRNIDSFLGSIKNEQVRDYLRIADNIKAGDRDAVGSSVSSKIIEIMTGRRTNTPAPSTPSELEYDAFTKDFSKGGWDAWYKMTQLGENPIAGILSTSQQLGKNITQQQQAINQELEQGNGFLSQKICVEYAPVPNIDDDDTSFGLNPDGSRKCLKFETVTPGSVIASQTQTITNSGTRQLEAADEINEVLGNFFNNLLNKLFYKGLQTLGRDSGDSFGDLSQFGGPGNNIVIGSNGQPINGTGSGVSLTYNQGGDDYDSSSFNISNPRHIANVIKSQKTFLNKAADSQSSLQKIVPNLGHLDYCLPGPTTSWKNNIPINSDILFSTIRMSGISRGIGSTEFNIEPYELLNSLNENYVPFSGKTLYVQNDLFVSGTEIASILSEWLNAFIQNINSNFSQTSLANAFASTETTASGQQFARGFVLDAISETSLIPQYVQNVVLTENQYNTAIAETRRNITELESIRAELLEIVTIARNRHITEKRAQGITVNMSCLNEAYDISNSSIVGVPRMESDATAQIEALQNAQDNFYNNL